jgi:large subunit ribosomal protein L24
MKLKKGDMIQVMAGKDRGRQGKIEKVLVAENRVLVPGLNQYKKHRKSQGEGKPGEILTLSRPFNISKVAMICTKCKQVTRIGYRYDEKKKVRVCRKCEADL